MTVMESSKQKKDVWYIICFFAVLMLIAFLAFYKLDVKYVDAWDEARHGVNAYEMANGGSIIQNTYLRQADYYNLKPPISMWVIMLGFSLFGNTVFALRVFSALCYVILAGMVGLFTRKYGKWESIVAMAFLAVNTTPFQAHMIRSGDADSIYVLLFTLAMLCMMKVADRVQYVYACGLFASLGFLTKSFHALLIPMIGFLYLLLTNLLSKMKIKDWLLFGLSYLGPILLWALLRMRMDGLTFFKAMWETDVLGRTSGELKNNISPFTYYFEYYFGTMSQKTTVYLCALILLFIGAVVFSKKLALSNRKNWLGFLLWIVIPFVAFSAVTNKLLWYVYPSLIALLVCAGIVTVRMVKSTDILPAIRGLLLVIVFIGWVYYVKDEISIIDKQGPNEIQTLLTTAADNLAKQEKSGKVLGELTAYVEYEQIDSLGDVSAWCQQDVFVCQIHGDYTCINGGAAQMMENQTSKDCPSVLLLCKQRKEEFSDAMQNWTLVADSDRYQVFWCE